MSAPMADAGTAPVKDLVVVRAGARSLHRDWLAASGEPRRFDLLVCAYAAEAMADDQPGLTHLFSPGSKIAGFNALMKNDMARLEGYERIAFIDDDIRTSHDVLARCFAIGRREQLAIWQPSLTWQSYFTYAGTLQVQGLSVRYVNYVEMMAPFFTREALLQVRHLFDLGLESGIDLIWCNLVQPAACGIVDETPVTHTKPVGAQKEHNGFVGRGYEDDIEKALARFGYVWPSLVARGGRTLGGAVIGRVRVVLYSMRLFRVPAATPNRGALRLVSDHIRHLFTRPFAMRMR